MGILFFLFVFSTARLKKAYRTAVVLLHVQYQETSLSMSFIKCSTRYAHLRRVSWRGSGGIRRAAISGTLVQGSWQVMEVHKLAFISSSVRDTAET